MRDVQKYMHKFTGKEAGYFLLTLAAALALWLFIAAGYRKEEVEEISKSLVTINSHKISQVAAWREEHSREALRLSRHSVFGEVVAEEIAHPGSRRAQLTAWLKDQLIQKQYISLAFLSPKGVIVAATPGFKADTEKYFKDVFTQAVREGTGLLTDLYLPADGRPGAAMIIPMTIGGRGGKPVTVLVINIDPETTFYPIVKAAPQFYASAETLLVRKEGERILYLSPLDHARDAALKLTRPIAEEQLPAAAAVRGGKGFFPGVDYRGVKVFSAMGPVPGSDWMVITKIDRAIILAPVKTREHLALLLILSGAGLIYFVVYTVLRARRRTAEAALAQAAKKHEIHFKTTLDSMLEGCMVIGFDWTYIYLNEAAARHGRNKQENLLGRTIIEMYPGIERTAIFAHYKSCMEKRIPEHFEESFTFSDGATLWFSFSVAPVQEGIFTLSLDITERRRAEEKLRESEERYRETVDLAVDGFLLGSPEGEIIGANSQMQKLSGRPLDKLLGQHVSSLFDPGGLNAAPLRFDRLNTGMTVITERNLLRPDGTTLPVEMHSKRMPDGTYQSIYRDITERRRVEEALRASEEKFRKAFHSSPQAITLTDLADGRLLEISGSFESVLGYSREEAVGHTTLELNIWPEEEDRKVYTGALKKDGSVHNRELKLRTKAGEIRDMLASAEQLEMGGKACMLAIFYDITERKAAELELQRVNLDLQSKKQEMENFLYITTHDLRSPLVNIQGFSQNLEHYLQELRDYLAPAQLPQPAGGAVAKLVGEKIPGALKFILESSRRMDSLISSLLKVARLGRVEMKPQVVKMNDLVKKITDSIRFQSDEAGVDIKTGVLPPCRADQTAVSQIFTNLLGNAIKYRTGDRALEITITGEVLGASVRYTVTDNGSGITAKDLPRIWDLFFRGGTPGMKGEGIGLTVVKYMVEKNGGSIKAESGEGQGSTFRLELPAGEEIE